MAIETMRTWKIGDVEITRIVEVNNWEDDITMLLPDAPPDTVLAYPWLQPHFATAQGKMIISFQCFVMRTADHQIMLDTCIGSDREREFDIFTNMRSDFLDDLAHAAGLALEQGTYHTKGQQHAPTAEIAYQVDGRKRRLAGSSDGMQRSCQGDVVDVMPGGSGQGAILAPTGRTSENQTWIALQANTRTQSQSFHHSWSKTFDQGICLLHKT